LATVAEIQWKPVIPSSPNSRAIGANAQKRDAANLDQIYEKICAQIRDNPNTQMEYAKMVIEVNFYDLLIIKNYMKIL
jgi:hypothetical protein